MPETPALSHQLLVPMATVLMIVQVVLAFAFFMAGVMKLMKPKDELRDKMAFVEDFSQQTIRAIGAVEVLGALGLILPWLTGIMPVLVPLAALGLALTMIGAMIVHIRRGEMPMVGTNVMLLAMALFVAWGRWSLL